MFLKLKLIFVNFALSSTLILQNRNLKILDYDYFWKEDLRKALDLEKTKLNKNLNHNVSQNNTVIVDSIVHELINRNNSKWQKINTLEINFKKIIRMKGIKYIYRRDMFWRTWRRINLPNADKKVVCYRCENKLKANSTNCESGGYWIIEDKPPCPYEFFSITKDDQLCAANFSQYEDKNSTCATVMRIENVINICNNPIETVWRITNTYYTQEHGVDICDGRESCDISTDYTIFKDYVIFRIINSNNVIIYSRVMKKGGRNYACVEDCGLRDPITKTVTRGIKALDLSSASNKRKRENKIADEIQTTVQQRNFIQNNELSFDNKVTTTMSTCNKLSVKDAADIDESERDYEY